MFSTVAVRRFGTYEVHAWIRSKRIAAIASRRVEHLQLKRALAGADPADPALRDAESATAALHSLGCLLDGQSRLIAKISADRAPLLEALSANHELFSQLASASVQLGKGKPIGADAHDLLGHLSFLAPHSDECCRSLGQLILIRTQPPAERAALAKIAIESLDATVRELQICRAQLEEI
jgi:hypothetical protein